MELGHLTADQTKALAVQVLDELDTDTAVEVIEGWARQDYTGHPDNYGAEELQAKLDDLIE